MKDSIAIIKNVVYNKYEKEKKLKKIIRSVEK
jgi:hypothetical protein